MKKLIITFFLLLVISVIYTTNNVIITIERQSIDNNRHTEQMNYINNCNHIAKFNINK